MTSANAPSSKRPGSGLTAKLAVSDLRAWFGDHEVLHGVDLEMGQSEVTAIIGPSATSIW